MDLITGCWTIIARSVCGNGASRVGRNNNILALAFERRYKIQKSYLDFISWPPNELEILSVAGAACYRRKTKSRLGLGGWKKGPKTWG